MRGLPRQARPRLDLAWGPGDRVLSAAALAALVTIGVVAVWAWPQLPAIIPMHFGFRGQPDGWGRRGLFLTLPAVAVLHYGLLTLAAKVPHLYNYPWPITAENAARQYVLARRLILALRLLVMLVLLAVVVTVVATSLGLGPGPWLLIGLPFALAAITIAYFVAARRAR